MWTSLYFRVADTETALESTVYRHGNRSLISCGLAKRAESAMLWYSRGKPRHDNLPLFLESRDGDSSRNFLYIPMAAIVQGRLTWLREQ
jgi:hypothetical protein